jgi:hypothetical protein
VSDLPPFREPWFRVDGNRAKAIEQEVAAEFGPEHELARESLIAVAACSGCDRVVFRLHNDRWAIVHLTWRPKKPDTPPWPTTARYGGFIAIEAGMDQHEH